MYKMPDGEDLVADLQQATFHSSNDTPTQRELRKYTVAKGMLVVNPSTAVSQARIFVKRKALARIAPMRENDQLRMVFAKAAEGTTAQVSILGNIYVRANA